MASFTQQQFFLIYHAREKKKTHKHVQGFEYITQLPVQRLLEQKGHLPLKHLNWKAGLSQHRYSLPQGNWKQKL